MGSESIRCCAVRSLRIVRPCTQEKPTSRSRGRWVQYGRSNRQQLFRQGDFQAVAGVVQYVQTAVRHVA